MRKRNIKEKKNKGFTLIELVIVVAILAILVGILAPQYTKYVEKSRKAADASNMDELVNVIKVYMIEGNSLATDKYIFTMTSNSKSGTGGGTYMETGDAKEDLNLKSEMDKAFPDWMKLTTKSKKWGTDGRAASIKSIITIESDGGMSVSYEPEKFAKYMAGES